MLDFLLKLKSRLASLYAFETKDMNGANFFCIKMEETLYFKIIPLYQEQI